MSVESIARSLAFINWVVLVALAVGSLAALAFVVFAAYNWQPVELTLWQNLVLETKVPMLALLAFTAGFLPMWALHRSVTWSQNRRIRALEQRCRLGAFAFDLALIGHLSRPVLRPRR